VASVPILKQGPMLIVSLSETLTDRDLLVLRDQLSQKVATHRSLGVVLDVSALDVMDSFSTRTLSGIAQATRLRGATTVIVGIQPDVAFSMVQMGLTLEGIETALDLDEGLEFLNRLSKEGAGRGT
jgi:rsbT antagonist protein RsbS